jgi:hypothetical protein
MIPQSFEQWKNCIVNNCKINLKKDFSNQRLSVLQDKNHSETIKFISLYGEQHLLNVINWLKQV